MKELNTGISVIIALIIMSMMQTSCKHNPIMDPGDMDMDTTGMDTTMVTDTCDPEFVYFQQQILPIFQSNCATSGCHNEESAEEDVILTDYENIIRTGEIEAFDLSGSEVWERITDSDPDKRMPPPPASRLTPGAISLIEKWILQGATDSSCIATECNTENISFQNDLTPIFSTYCYSCHTGSTPEAGINLSVYSDVKSVADMGVLYCAVAHLQGCTNMPLGGNKIPQCDIDQIKAWIDDGAPNN